MSIEIRRLGFSYGSTDVLHDITFTAADGDIAAVLGPNGVGKSTLFRCVLGFLAPSEGGILVNGKDMRTLDRRAAAREIAYIPQSCVPSFNYTLLEVVMMGLTNQIGVFDAPRPEHKTAALEAMESLGIAHLAHRESGRVSGGERQLALLARAMVQNARVLVMDEPTANLDCGNSALVMERVSALAGEAGARPPGRQRTRRGTAGGSAHKRNAHKALRRRHGGMSCDGCREELLRRRRDRRKNAIRLKLSGK